MPGNLADKVKRYFGFSSYEKKWIIISILAMTLIAGFDDGSEAFDASYWLFNFFNVFLIVTLAVLVRESAHRIYGLSSGFRVEYVPSFHMIVIGLILAFMSMGRVMFLAPNTVKIHMLETHRLGYFRYGLGYSTLGIIALMGPASNILLALFFKLLTAWSASPLVEKAVLINVIFAISNMLPFPGLDGLQVFFSSRLWYFFAFGAIAGMAIFLLGPGFSLLASLVGAMVVGIMFCVAYFGLLEKKVT